MRNRASLMDIWFWLEEDGYSFRKFRPPRLYRVAETLSRRERQRDFATSLSPPSLTSTQLPFTVVHLDDLIAGDYATKKTPIELPLFYVCFVLSHFRSDRSNNTPTVPHGKITIIKRNCPDRVMSMRFRCRRLCHKVYICLLFTGKITIQRMNSYVLAQVSVSATNPQDLQ